MKKKCQEFAVVGMDCRFPGADNYHQFWENLENNVSSIREVPEDRWHWEDYYGDPETEANRTKVKWGGFISDIDKFDPMFFGISPKEAACIDPQHRLFLMSSWKSLEDAGYNIEALSGKRIGVYAGVSKNDYAELMRELKQDIAPFVSTGTVHSILSNRVSFLFDFHGRSESVDTACSSGLVALHNAMRDIENDECESAIVGGVNALLSPTMYLSHSKSGMLSADGECKTFDEGANGYVRAEGVGTLYIKALSRAIDDGDHIHAIIKGSAINHGGRANFLTSPTVRAQSEVIQEALNSAQVDPNTITYVEAHGTGTPMGDPIEISALKDAYMRAGNKENSHEGYCALSAVKTNVGHLESASGIAGIIKAILSLQHKIIPSLQNFNCLNPYLEIEKSPFFIADKNIEWKRINDLDGNKAPRRASVSSFGMGGVNGHVILEEAPALNDEYQYSIKNQVLIPLSSKNKDLEPYLKEVHEFLLVNQKTLQSMERNVFLERFAYTLSCGRSQMVTRLAFVVSSLDQLIECIEKYLKGESEIPGCVFGNAKVKRGEKPTILHVDPLGCMHKVASEWVKGSKLDWSSYYPSHSHPRRLPLPTYRFARKRCWFSDEIVRPKEEYINGVELSPEIRTPSGLVKMKGAVFSKLLSGKEFYLRDHVVQGTKFLPGVAYLELARAASEFLDIGEDILRIQDVYWIKPVAVTDKELMLEIRLDAPIKKEGSGTEALKYEVHVGECLHGKGILVLGRLSESRYGGHMRGLLSHSRLDIYTLKRSISSTVVDKSALYQKFQEFGLSYGESFRPIEECQVSRSEVLTKLIAPAGIHSSFSDFMLHPTMMDGLFQSIVSLTILGQECTDFQYVPFSLECIEILGEIGTTQWAYVRASNIQGDHENSALHYDGVMMDEQGKVIIKLYGLQKRAIGPAISGTVHLTSSSSRPIKSESPSSQVCFDTTTVPERSIYYRSIFSPMPIDHSNSTVPTALLVLSNQQDIRKEVAFNLPKDVPIFVVSTGDGYKVFDEFNVGISPDNQEDFIRLVEHVKCRKIKISHVLHMWNMDRYDREDENSEASVKSLGIYSVLSLVQALMKKHAFKKMKMVYCYSEIESELRPCHAMVGGFARTLIYENPNIEVHTLGLARHEEEVNGCGNASILAMDELLNNSNAKLHEIKFTGGVRKIRQVIGFSEDMNLKTDVNSLFRKRGTYIFSGGAGGLGVIFSSYLAKVYSANIILLGRSKQNKKIEGICETIASLGGRCEYFSADLADPIVMADVIARIRDQHRVIHGVIHAAGVIEDAYIIRKSFKSFKKVVETKTTGVRNLDTLTKNDDLDFFMMFSSIAALMPNQGQSDYAAANSYLDYFSSYRNQLVNSGKRRGISVAINWPLWANGGMGVTKEEEAHLLTVFGMKPLETPLGIEVFESALKLVNQYRHTKQLDQVFVIDGDKEKISSCLGVVVPPPAVNHSITKIKETSPTPLVLADAVVSKKGVRIMPSQYNADLDTSIDGKEYVLALFSRHFDVSQENIDIHANFNEFGVDSMVMITIAKEINAYFSVDIKPIVFFEVNTIERFIQHIEKIAGEKFYGKKTEILPLHNRSLIDPDISSPKDMTFKRRFNVDEFYLRDHVVEDQYNMPGACYIEMARQCGDQLFGDGAVKRLMNNYWVSQLSSPSSDFDAYVNVTKKDNCYEYEVVSYGDYPNVETKNLHAMGQFSIDIGSGYQEARTQKIDLEDVRKRCVAKQTPDEVYPQIIAEGLHVGPTFMPMSEIHLSQGRALACLELPDGISDTDGDYILHPTILTGVFQTALISNRYDKENTSRQYIPISIDEISLYGPVSGTCFVVSTANKRNSKNKQLKKFDLCICNDNGEVLVKLTGFSIRALPKTAKTPVLDADQDLGGNTESATYGENTPLVDQSGLLKRTGFFIKGLLSGPVGLPETEIDSEQEFDAYGINSVMIVELNKLFENSFGPLSKTLFFEYSNVAELAEYFIDSHQDRLNDILGVTPLRKEGGDTDDKDENLTGGIATATSITDVAAGYEVTNALRDIVEPTQYMLKELLSEPLGLAVEDVDIEESFESYGINSVMIVDLNKRFENKFGGLSKTLFFEYANIEELSEYFIENHQDTLLALLGMDASVGASDSKVSGFSQSFLPRHSEESLGDKNDPIRTQKEHKQSTLKPRAPEITQGREPQSARNEKKIVQDIAIIGVAGRYPEAENITQFWDLLKAGRDCIKEVPKSHFDGDSIFDANPERNKIYSRQGGFIEDVDKFDAAFFNISPREAELIDPQERLFLEVTWSALEDAGYTPDSLREMSGGEVGVFVGALWQPYQSIGTEETMNGNPVAPSGLLYSIANRISYYLNLSGPSLAIDTACSASLTAVHMACQSIRSGDCNVAIAGGVNLSLHSSKYLFLSQNRFLSTDGRCRSFGDGGDGYVPGEGVGSILLKPLDEAINDNDQIYAVINGSAVNHGGKTHGYSVPNPNAQAALIQKTLERSQVDPRSISYVEAHGTGTPLGDPIEITGLKKAFQTQTKDKQFCAIGSVKSNIGHLEAAAGIAAITKTVLQMKHNTLVPSIHANALNKNIDFDDSPFQVQRSLGAWKKSEVDQSRRAGISSFGAGGANAHLILEQYNEKYQNKNGHALDPGADGNSIKNRITAPAIVVLSAKRDDRLKVLASNLKIFLEESLKSDTPILFESLLFTLQVGRQAMSSRLAVISDSVEDLCMKLSGFLKYDSKVDGVYEGDSGTKNTLSLFSGDEDIGAAVDAWVAKSKMKKVAQLWVSGFSIDWRRYYIDNKPRKISLPTYPFEKSRYWMPKGLASESVARNDVGRLHPLVHKNISTLQQQQFRTHFDGREFFLDDHRVGVDRILPAVAYIEMFRTAAALSDEASCVYRLCDLAWSTPIAVGSDSTAGDNSRHSVTDIDVVVVPDNNAISIRAQVVSEDAITVHCEGEVVYAQQHADELQHNINVGETIDSTHSELNKHEIYRVLKDKGLNLGAAFQGLEWVKWEDGRAIGKISLPKKTVSDNRSHYSVHPSLLDSALQVALSVLEMQHTRADTLYLPLSIEEVTFFDDLPDDIYSVVRPSDSRDITDSSATVRSFDVNVCDIEGRIVLQVKNIAFKETNMASGSIRSQYEKDETISPLVVTYSTFDWISSELVLDEMKLDKKLESVDFSQPMADKGALIDSLDRRQKKDRVLIVSNAEELLDTFLSTINEGEIYALCETILVCDRPLVAQRNRLIFRSNDSFELLGELLSNTDRKIDQFIYLWNTGKEFNIGGGESTVANEATVLLNIVFNLNRQFSKSSYAQSHILISVSDESDNASENIMSGALAGYLKSLSSEYPKSINRIISIPKHSFIENGVLLKRELTDVYRCLDAAGTTKENNQWVRYEQRLESTTRYLKQLSPLHSRRESVEEIAEFSGIRHKGCYLISGGMGGIGKCLSRYLAEKYSATLILLGRSELNEDIESQLSLLIDRGGNPFYFSVDISDMDELRQAIEKMHVSCGSIDGVIHAAGKIDDNFLFSKSAESFNSVLHPKVSGTVNLDLVTRDEPLDFFMGFSSLTAVFGNAGQCDYGAANGFLDAYIAYRSECALAPGISLGINWPLWLEGGMGASSNEVDIEEGLDEHFGEAIGSEVGLKCFEQSLFLDQSQVIVVKEYDHKNVRRQVKMNIKEEHLDKVQISNNTIVSSKPQINYNAINTTNTISSSKIDTSDVELYLYEDVRDIIAKKGKFDPQRIRPSDNFIALGLESVFLTSLAGQVNKKYGIRLSPATFFEYSNLEALVSYILDDYREEILAVFNSAQTDGLAEISPVAPVEKENIRKAVALNIYKNSIFSSRFQNGNAGQQKQVMASDNNAYHNKRRKYAIVGMDCLFPGAPDLESFWHVLESGKSMISEIPEDRWDWQSIYGDPSQETNKTNIKWGGFVEDIDKFDPEFFNISPREAALMDPQQRIVLQSVWKAIEHAGYAPLSLSDTHKVGLFLGASTNDYFELLAKRDVEAYSSTGGVHSITANRVSYLLDFKGPSIPVDTACSSSLVALDMAVKSLEDGQCDVAIVGGVNALITPTLYLAFSKAGMLSPTGVISPLDKSADGYVRSEGVGVLVLKKLDRAIEDNDTVHALVRGTAVNHGGRVSSLTVPNPNAQADLILDACDKAEVDVTTLSFIEMHGTGTPLGDPVEVNGLKKAFKQGAEVKKSGYCGISSVKGNLGHLEAAAGIAGVIKTVLSLQQKTLCAQGNFHELNPHIQLENSPFEVVEKTCEWPHIRNERGEVVPRRAGVSSFGFGGANAHTILEEYVSNDDSVNGRHADDITGAIDTEERKERGSVRFSELSDVFVLSAKTHQSLQKNVLALKSFLIDKKNSNVNGVSGRALLDDIAFTLQTGRSAMAHRLAIRATHLESLINSLSVYLDGSNSKITENSYENTVFIGDCRDIDGFEYRYDGTEGLAECLTQWVDGADIDWQSYYPSGSRKRIPLPTYVFARERYWLPPEATTTEKVELSESLDKREQTQEPKKEFCIRYLTSVAAEVLQTSPSKIKRATPLDQYGMDSMMVIQVVNTLKSSFKGIDSVVLMRYRTIEALCEYFLKEYEAVILALYQDHREKSSLHKGPSTKNDSKIEVSGIAQDLADGKFDFKDAIKKIRGVAEQGVQVVSGDKEANRETV